MRCFLIIVQNLECKQLKMQGIGNYFWENGEISEGF